MNVNHIKGLKKHKNTLYHILGWGKTYKYSGSTYLLKSITLNFL